jgi:hypothetical protein
MENQHKFFEDLLKDEPRFEYAEEKDYTLAELDQLKTENYITIGKEGDLVNAKSRLLFDKNFK